MPSAATLPTLPAVGSMGGHPAAETRTGNQVGAETGEHGLLAVQVQPLRLVREAAEELGRAFAKYKVITSGGDNVRIDIVDTDRER